MLACSKQPHKWSLSLALAKLMRSKCCVLVVLVVLTSGGTSLTKLRGLFISPSKVHHTMGSLLYKEAHWERLGFDLNLDFHNTKAYAKVFCKIASSTEPSEMQNQWDIIGLLKSSVKGLIPNPWNKQLSPQKIQSSMLCLVSFFIQARNYHRTEAS